MTELSPLVEIEQLVQARAKDRSFDVRAAGGSPVPQTRRRPRRQVQVQGRSNHHVTPL